MPSLRSLKHTSLYLLRVYLEKIQILKLTKLSEHLWFERLFFLIIFFCLKIDSVVKLYFLNNTIWFYTLRQNIKKKIIKTVY